MGPFEPRRTRVSGATGRRQMIGLKPVAVAILVALSACDVRCGRTPTPPPATRKHNVDQYPHTHPQGAPSTSSLRIEEEGGRITGYVEICNQGQGKLGFYISDRGMWGGFTVVRGTESIIRHSSHSSDFEDPGPIVWIAPGQRYSFKHDLSESFEFAAGAQVAIVFECMGLREDAAKATGRYPGKSEFMTSNEALYRRK